ncbi:hypothetical protein NDU88_006322 [Pleurodeles waltl]|uniref:Uncharacterized protein n=1 Tax=Pleurodeles waltl TaxID=8319 RepID=A0AAV7QL09_PLEWA|nr:hypothetical protein NDU88_006322 [Pleurodeles waltl]
METGMSGSGSHEKRRLGPSVPVLNLCIPLPTHVAPRTVVRLSVAPTDPKSLISAVKVGVLMVLYFPVACWNPLPLLRESPSRRFTSSVEGTLSGCFSPHQPLHGAMKRNAPQPHSPGVSRRDNCGLS